uniref:Mediator of RNA polymerase II transcription subunit 24 n=2 Tax=Timema TaxID=61471 RepID=A0A7R9CPZ7_TIMCR|nr:unnamed protein product [Timema cristinae]
MCANHFTNHTLLGNNTQQTPLNTQQTPLNTYQTLIKTKNADNIVSRESTSPVVPRLEQAQSQSASIPKVIIRAEPTLARILKTLDADYVKVQQEALLSVLCQVLTGKSFELILSVAIVEGKLRTFVTKLIKFNECSKQPLPGSGGETTKTSHTRAMLFDVSFLMLCSIVHTYGSEVVLSEEGGDSFFEQWVRECMVERGRPKCPDQMLQYCEPGKVDALLGQFNSPDNDFKTSSSSVNCIPPCFSGVKWHEVCHNVPGAIKEVLLAWEQGAVTSNDVKRILDVMRSRMCSLPVFATAWLCSYMQILHQDALLKPMNMVQQFLTPVANEESTQLDNFKERSGLMFQVIRKMQYDVFPPSQSKVKAMTLSHSIISRQPVSSQLGDVWEGIQKRGWIHIQATHSLESLLNTSGCQWFVTNIVKEVLNYRYQEMLEQAVDLAFGVFHLDIEKCTLALLLHVLPQYLHNRLQSEELVEPQASALAKLCAYCVFAALEYQNNSAPGSRKRSRRDKESEDLEGMCPTNKLLRTAPETSDPASLFGAPHPGNSSMSSSSSTNHSSPPVTIREPLQSALAELFHMLTVVVCVDLYIDLVCVDLYIDLVCVDLYIDLVCVDLYIDLVCVDLYIDLVCVDLYIDLVCVDLYIDLVCVDLYIDLVCVDLYIDLVCVDLYIDLVCVDLYIDLVCVDLYIDLVCVDLYIDLVCVDLYIDLVCVDLYIDLVCVDLYIDLVCVDLYIDLVSGRDGEVSQRTHFVCKFLQFLVQCGNDRTRLVLQGMPNTMVPCLLRALPELFSTDLLLRLYDLQTVVGRKATARDLCMLRNMDLKFTSKDTV